AASLAFDRLGDVAPEPELGPAGERGQIAVTKGGQVIQLSRGGPPPVRLDQLGGFGLQDLRERGVAPMRERAIRKQREVDDPEFVATEGEAADIRREDGRPL